MVGADRQFSVSTLRKLHIHGGNMQPSRLTYFTAFALFASLAAPALFSQAANNNQPRHYYVFNLGVPGGGTIATPASVNNAGWVAGAAFQSGNTSEHAELWVGVPLDLGTFGGPNSAVAWPNKNNQGEIAGIAETSEANPLQENWSCALANFPTITNQVCLGFVWKDGVMSALPTLGGYDGYAAGNNNRGQVAGWAENTVHDSTCVPPQVLQFEPVIWGPALGQLTQLPPLSGDVDGAATAINDQGQAVGISGICDQAVGRYTAKHAVLWENGVTTNLGNFDGGVAWNTPTAINNRGEVVGFANLANTPSGELNPIAFVWTKSQPIQQLPLLGQDGNSLAWGINNLGQVVGQSVGATSARAFLYQNGTITDLNALTSPDSALYLLLANDINDRGEITGFALDSTTGDTVGFLAVPEPGTGAEQPSAAGHTTSRSIEIPPNLLRQMPGFGRFALGAIGTK
jgi:probable HAF family extracellular repeat protein